MEGGSQRAAFGFHQDGFEESGIHIYVIKSTANITRLMTYIISKIKILHAHFFEVSYELKFL